jgi:hypothetical protein
VHFCHHHSLIRPCHQIEFTVSSFCCCGGSAAQCSGDSCASQCSGQYCGCTLRSATCTQFFVRLATGINWAWTYCLRVVISFVDVEILWLRSNLHPLLVATTLNTFCIGLQLNVLFSLVLSSAPATPVAVSYIFPVLRLLYCMLARGVERNHVLVGHPPQKTKE